MTDAALEFSDLMNHQVTARSKSTSDDYGNTDYTDATKRSYICLLQDEEVVARSQEGVSIHNVLTVYCTTIPFDPPDTVEPWLILPDDEITVDVPAGYGKRTLDSVAVYYDETGIAYSHTLRLA
jgi:hypothetical protein